MHVSLLQFASGPDVGTNLDTMARLTRAAVQASPRVDLVVAPEAAQVEFGTPDTPLAPAAEPLDGPFVTELGRLAAEVDTTIVAGMFERLDGEDTETGRVANTVVVLSPDGRLTATYRKIHLYDAFGVRESDRLLPGELSPAVVDVAGHRVGLATCYDLRFPELLRMLAANGAEVFAVPAAWHRGPLKEDHWSTLVRARAIENTCYVAAAGQSPPAYCGRSMVVDPLGVPLTALGEGVDWCVAEVRAERLREVRQRNPTLEHRRFAVVRPEVQA